MSRSTTQLSRLSPTERDVFESVDVEGLPVAELAEHMSMSASTIRTHAVAAREKLGGPERAAAVADARRDEDLADALDAAGVSQLYPPTTTKGVSW